MAHFSLMVCGLFCIDVTIYGTGMVDQPFILRLPQLPALFTKDLRGCDGDGRPLSEGKTTPTNSVMSLPPAVAGYVVCLKRPKGILNYLLIALLSFISTIYWITLFCVHSHTQPTDHNAGLFMVVVMSGLYRVSIVPPSPHRGRPRRRCGGLCVCSLRVPAGSTESARRRWSTTPARRTSSWSLSRSSSAPTTLPKLPSNLSL